MRVIMTGGGTGGHIYPAIAIADKIKQENPEADIIFVGTQRGLEADIVPKQGYSIRFITVSGFNRKKMLKNFRVAADLLMGFAQARKIIREFKPDMVIGTGGYVSGPVVRMAHQMGVRTYIHEQNAFPGVTNKLVSKSVERVFLGFEEASRHFKHKEKLVLTGNPVRKEFEGLNRTDCRRQLGIPENSFMILAFGGSGGAGRLNSEILNVAKNFSDVPEVSIFFATGKVYYKQILEKIKAEGLSPSPRLGILSYIEKMHLYMGAADLVISRAGALTVAEITLCGKASILIPSPNVTGNHQYFNAKAVADRGGAVLIEEKDLDEKKVVEVVRSLMGDKDCLTRMETASLGCAHRQASEKIVEAITNDFEGFSWGKNDIGHNKPG